MLKHADKAISEALIQHYKVDSVYMPRMKPVIRAIWPKGWREIIGNARIVRPPIGAIYQELYPRVQL